MLKKENKELLEDVLTKYVCERYRDIENNGNARFTAEDMEMALKFLEALLDHEDTVYEIEVREDREGKDIDGEIKDKAKEAFAKLGSALDNLNEATKKALGK